MQGPSGALDLGLLELTPGHLVRERERERERMSEGGEDATLEFTPTWAFAVVCSVVIAMSLGAGRILDYAGKYLKHKNQKPLYEALQKVKEELRSMGFMSLLLTVFQVVISKICVPADIMKHVLPCSLSEAPAAEEAPSSNATMHFQRSLSVQSSSLFLGKFRKLLAETSTATSATSTCAAKNKVPLLSTEALYHLDFFISVLAIVHVTFCVLTVLFGSARIRQWKRWEDSIADANYDTEQALKKVTHVHQHAFIRDHFLGIGKNSALLGWLHSFFKQFYAAVTEADYTTLRLGFIMRHCKSNPNFNFHEYMIRALEDDFKHVVGISWYLWIFVVVFLLLNVNGWHTYFWIAFIPFILLLAVGTKLVHVMTQLADEFVGKHVAVEGDLVVQPSDEHFWFNCPKFVLFLIHFILFQNAFEIAFFFWIWVQYGFDSCMMGQVRYIVPRLIIGVIIQVLCSYSTLPLYAIVTQMGSFFKKAILDEHVRAGLVGWAQKAKKKKGAKPRSSGDGSGSGSGQASSNSGSSVGVQLARGFRKASAPDEIQTTHASEGSK